MIEETIGIRKLMCRMLELAVREFVYGSEDSPYYKSARTYINDSDNKYAFSFNNICDSLDFEPDYIRRKTYSLL